MVRSIAVYCASSMQIDDSFFRDARQLGRLMGEKGLTLYD